MRKPYAFPLRSRKAMTNYVCDRRRYVDHYRNYPFSWNVKAHRVNWDCPKGEHIPNPAHQAAWERHVAKSEYVCANAFEDAQRHYSEGEYTTYPGDDQDAWQFAFLGRQGGHLCLESWRGQAMSGFELDADWCAELTFAELRALYRALVCMDSDFTPAKASEEVEYHLNYQRQQFDEECDEKLTCLARRIESSRPDMYAA